MSPHQLTERFFRYVAISSQSIASNTQLPSSEGQLTLARLLADELKLLNLKDIHIDQHGILTACLTGECTHAPKIGFVAHLDTVDVGLSPDIKPQICHFTGHDICLNSEQDIWCKVADHPELLNYRDEDIIFSDGTSVLGADNKAAITVIMSLLTELAPLPQTHGDIYVAFVPDEEVGLRGSKKLDLTRFPVDFAYTIDSCEIGEVVYETFNAAAATITITGITAHPMSAKNVLVNPLRVMHDFMGCFDRRDTPEHTELREGYFWFTDLVANPNQAHLTMAIRDFDLTIFNARKAFIEQAIALTQARHPKAQIACAIEDVYSNISQSLGENRNAIDLIFQAMTALNIPTKVIPMRGGTDGSALSARGVLTPNYFTGAHNFHSRFEFLPLSAFMASYALTQKICLLAAQKS